MSLTEYVADGEQDKDLKATIRRLMQQLDKAKASKAELVQAVYQAARDGISGLDIPPVPTPAKDSRRKKTPEVAIAVLSDFQLGKRTPTYNSEVCEQRVEQYAQKVIELTDIQRADHPVKELRVYLLGDILENELLFKGQPHQIDASLYQQVVVDGPRIVTNFIRTMLSNFEKVRVEGVVGNHGRVNWESHPETNCDAMIYEISRQILKDEKRLEWGPNSIPGQRKWYAVDYIGNKGFLLFHGDQIRGGSFGIPWYGFYRRLQGWRNGAISEPFEYGLSGHFHTPVRLFVNTLTLWGNGATESSNQFAQEQLAASGRPCQWLLFCHPEKGVSAEYLVRLD